MINAKWLRKVFLIGLAIILACCASARLKYVPIIPDGTFSNCGFVLHTPPTEGWFAIKDDLQFTIRKMGGAVIEGGDAHFTNPYAPWVTVTARCYNFENSDAAVASMMKRYKSFQNGDNLSMSEVKIINISALEKVRNGAKCMQVMQTLVKITPSEISESSISEGKMSENFDWKLKWIACQHPKIENNYLELEYMVESLPGQYPEMWAREAEAYIQSLGFY